MIRDDASFRAARQSAKGKLTCVLFFLVLLCFSVHLRMLCPLGHLTNVPSALLLAPAGKKKDDALDQSDRLYPLGTPVVARVRFYAST